MRKNTLETNRGCQTIYDVSGDVLFTGEWDPRAIFSALTGDDVEYWRDKHVLDIGANTAGLSLEIARHGAAVTAIEPDPYSNTRSVTLELVEDLVHREGLNLTLRRAGLFEAHSIGAFDAVLFLGLLYHFRDPQYCLDYLSTVEMTDLFISTQTASGDTITLVNRRSPDVLPDGFLSDDVILTGWHPTRPLFERMLYWAGFDNVRPLTDPSLNFPKKPAGLTNSAYYRAKKSRTVDPDEARMIYYPR